MTKEERWKAAIEEMKPLLETVRQIRDKYDLARVEVRARNYDDVAGRMAVATAGDDRDNVEVGTVYGMSWYDYEDDSLTNNYTEWDKQEDSEDE